MLRYCNYRLYVAQVEIAKNYNLMVRHMKARAIVLALIAAACLTSWSQPASAEWYRVCIGQYANRCSGGYNYWFGCGTNRNGIAQRICTIYTPRGPIYRRVDTVTAASYGGNRCGYLIFDVFCYHR